MTRRDDMDAFISACEGEARDALARQVRERFRWPAPNPDEALAEAWDEYEAAYARHVWGGEAEPSATGMPEDTGDQLAAAWERLCYTMMGEGAT